MDLSNITVKEFLTMRKPGKTLFFLLLCFFLFLSTACAYEKTETGFFTIFYNKQDHKAAKLLIQNADKIAEQVSGILGFQFTERVNVIIASAHSEFKKVQPQGSKVPSWAIGVAYPSKNLIILQKNPRFDIIKTFRHETTHILLGQAFKGKERVPLWLNEGLALIIAGEWSIYRLSTITSAVLTDSLIPMDSIVNSFPADLKDAELAYCQSFYFISFLKGKFGAAAFKAFLKEYSRHKNFYNAIRKTYHVSWNKMEALWLDYLGLRFSWIPVLTSTGFLWFAASIIFILGYIRKKRMSRIKLQEWDLEEEE